MTDLRSIVCAAVAVAALAPSVAMAASCPKDHRATTNFLTGFLLDRGYAPLSGGPAGVHESVAQSATIAGEILHVRTFVYQGDTLTGEIAYHAYYADTIDPKSVLVQEDIFLTSLENGEIGVPVGYQVSFRCTGKTCASDIRRPDLPIFEPGFAFSTRPDAERYGRALICWVKGYQPGSNASLESNMSSPAPSPGNVGQLPGFYDDSLFRN